MTIDRYIRLVAGSFVLISLALGVRGSPVFVSSYWLIWTAFVGLNLFQSSLTGFCPLVNILRAVGVPESRPGRDTAA